MGCPVLGKQSAAWWYNVARYLRQSYSYLPEGYSFSNNITKCFTPLQWNYSDLLINEYKLHSLKR